MKLSFLYKSFLILISPLVVLTYLGLSQGDQNWIFPFIVITFFIVLIIKTIYKFLFF